MGKVKNHHFYVCSHTHWDREWYGPFEDFRMRLVELTDELLGYLEDEPEYRCFNFDGQTVVIRDYLEIRPRRLDEVRKLAAAGRLAHHALRAAKRLFGISDFWYYALADGIREILFGRQTRPFRFAVKHPGGPFTQLDFFDLAAP